MYIEKVNSPADVKKLSVSEMNGLGGEIRQVLLNKLSSHGGHVGPNLGMVEATICLLYTSHRIGAGFELVGHLFDAVHQRLHFFAARHLLVVAQGGRV